jgi:hypothetical protein
MFKRHPLGAFSDKCGAFGAILQNELASSFFSIEVFGPQG